MLDRSVNGSDHAFGFISKTHGHIIGIEMVPDSHLPPPPFGTFIKCNVENEILIGIVFNAKIKNINVRPDDPEQSPAVLMIESKQSRIQLIAELQAVMIGSMVSGTDHFRHHYYQNPTIDSPVFAINESMLNQFAFSLNYIKTLINLSDNIPTNDLIITLIRKFSLYYPDKHVYSKFIYQELNELFDYDRYKVNHIIDRAGIHVTIRM